MKLEKAILMNNLKTPMTATQQMCSKCYAWVDRDMLIERNGLFYMENCFNCTNCKINLANLPFELRKVIRSKINRRKRCWMLAKKLNFVTYLPNQQLLRIMKT